MSHLKKTRGRRRFYVSRMYGDSNCNSTAAAATTTTTAMASENAFKAPFPPLMRTEASSFSSLRSSNCGGLCMRPPRPSSLPTYILRTGERTLSPPSHLLRSHFSRAIGRRRRQRGRDSSNSCRPLPLSASEGERALQKTPANSCLPTLAIDSLPLLLLAFLSPFPCPLSPHRGGRIFLWEFFGGLGRGGRDASSLPRGPPWGAPQPVSVSVGGGNAKALAGLPPPPVAAVAGRWLLGLIVKETNFVRG